MTFEVGKYYKLIKENPYKNIELRKWSDRKARKCLEVTTKDNYVFEGISHIWNYKQNASWDYSYFEEVPNPNKKKFKLGDIVKFKIAKEIPNDYMYIRPVQFNEKHGSIILGDKYNKEYAKVVEILKDGYTLEWHDVSNKEMRLAFYEDSLELVRSENILGNPTTHLHIKGTNKTLGEEKKMEKPKTQLEKKALDKAREDAVNSAIEEKKKQYESSLKIYIDSEHIIINMKSEIKSREKEQKIREETLGITPAIKKDLF